jgi:hypothetical protein
MKVGAMVTMAGTIPAAWIAIKDSNLYRNLSLEMAYAEREQMSREPTVTALETIKLFLMAF